MESVSSTNLPSKPEGARSVVDLMVVRLEEGGGEGVVFFGLGLRLLALVSEESLVLSIGPGGELVVGDGEGISLLSIDLVDLLVSLHELLESELLTHLGPFLGVSSLESVSDDSENLLELGDILHAEHLLLRVGGAGTSLHGVDPVPRGLGTHDSHSLGVLGGSDLLAISTFWTFGYAWVSICFNQFCMLLKVTSSVQSYTSRMPMAPL